MAIVDSNEERDERISMEIIVDAYDEYEQAMGWYYYLEEKLNCPFSAKWLSQKEQSGGREVKVVGMPAEDECEREMFVEVLYRDDDGEDVFVVPLSKIEPIDADAQTQEAIADWHYWIGCG